MSTAIQRAEQIIRSQGGIIRTSEALVAGIHRRTLYAMRDEGYLEQLSRGVFRLENHDYSTDPDLSLVVEKVPNGVMCLISALAIHEMTTHIPHVVHLAIPRTARYPVLPEVRMEVYRFSKASYQAGIEEIVHSGIALHVYTAEKTVADCFKYRNKIGLDLVIEGVRILRRRKQGWNPQRILEYARINRVEKQITPYLEALM